MILYIFNVSKSLKQIRYRVSFMFSYLLCCLQQQNFKVENTYFNFTKFAFHTRHLNKWFFLFFISLICLIVTFIFLCRQENETKETPDLNFIHTSFIIILHRTSELVNLQIFLCVSKFTQTPQYCAE